MAERPGFTERLDSWKDIATYLGRNVRTAMRWEQVKGLPVHRVPGGHRQAVYAWAHEIDEWLRNGHLETDAGEGELYNPDPEAIPADHSLDLSMDNSDLEPVPCIAPVTSVAIPDKGRVRTVALLAAALIIVVVGAYGIRSLAFSDSLRFTRVTQITNDGAAKVNLVTDGKNLYFGEDRNGRVVLSTVSAEGGTVHTVATPFVKATPADVSRDGKELLVLDGEGEEVERALWIVDLTGGPPHRVGAILCHSAVWSPDGRNIAFAAGNTVYLTSDAGKPVQELQTFSSVPISLGWFTDGLGLRIDLRDPKSRVDSFSDLSFFDAKNLQVSSLTPLHLELSTCDSSKLGVDERARSFIPDCSKAERQILLLEKDRSLWNSRFELVRVDNQIGRPEEVALAQQTQKLYVIGNAVGDSEVVPQTAREDLIEYDFRSHSFKPFLPDIFARDVDYSPNGQEITYVRPPDLTLWVSHADGSNARQVDFNANDLELPRWSPNGKWIAFMARVPGRPFRIYVVPAAGGKPHEISDGVDNQGAPTWSPDSKWVIYGDVECQATKTCAIHRIDFSSGQVVTVPGSEGLGTARWSPDGRFVAALSLERRQVMLFEFATQRWQKIADNVNGNDLSWSSDSRYVLASRPSGDHPEILRISIKDLKVDTVVDLSSFAKWTGRIDTWFTLTPSGSIIFQRGMSANEIYAISYEDK